MRRVSFAAVCSGPLWSLSLGISLRHPMLSPELGGTSQSKSLLEVFLWYTHPFFSRLSISTLVYGENRIQTKIPSNELLLPFLYLSFVFFFFLCMFFSFFFSLFFSLFFCGNWLILFEGGGVGPSTGLHLLSSGVELLALPSRGCRLVLPCRVVVVGHSKKNT